MRKRASDVLRTSPSPLILCVLLFCSVHQSYYGLANSFKTRGEKELPATSSRMAVAKALHRVSLDGHLIVEVEKRTFGHFAERVQRRL